MVLGAIAFIAIVLLVLVGIAKLMAPPTPSNISVLTDRYPLWDIHCSDPGQYVLGINPERDEVLIGRSLSVNAYPISAIASVELLRDGVTVTTTDRGSQAVGALVGV